MTVADQFLALLVPKPKAEQFQAAEQGDGWHTLKEPVRLVALFQVIIRNPRAEMMEVMKPNVAGEPLQDLGQPVERAPF